MEPKDIIKLWVEAFNQGDAEKIATFYSDDAVNHQVANEPVMGKAAIKKMFVDEFAAAEMVCIVENIFQDGDWAILEWKDPMGLRGCGFFKFEAGLITFQRGYWDKLSFLKAHNLPVPVYTQVLSQPEDIRQKANK
ncbi:nuclear transport factor 2 family protein [Vibrio quintilis]|uniref:SnoaL-like domain protein n=1 Tax=Vibrio quintilis TaxID=1117707 RepID=A0A1M7YQX4_9VIBR|nr:nuclear transport factor 2 family protein [Vibrio quintilis]SHO55000.1 SnoaL-like domain protein [Vibrio quintilis]